jgi:hypothetical protein
MVVEVTEPLMLDVGLGAAGFTLRQIENASEETNRNRFCSHYGADTVSCCSIFRDIQIKDIGDAKIHNPNVTHFLMAMYWLKRYQTETNMSGKFGLHNDTIRKWCLKYTVAIQSLISYKVSSTIFCNIINSSLH